MKKRQLQLTDYLNGCASFLACLKPFMRLNEMADGIECKLTLANGVRVSVTGKDQPHLLLNLMSELVNLIPEPNAREQHVKKSASRSAPANGQVLETIMHPKVNTTQMDEETRTARETIGLTTKVSLHTLVKAVAEKRGVSVSKAAWDLLQDGLIRFDKDSKSQSPSKLLTDYERKANDYDGADSASWVIRADRRLVMKTRLRAGEYERSLSSFANSVIADALSYCPVAAALRETAHAPAITEEGIAFAISKIEQSCGPRARALAVEIGLGEQRGLTNMILGGAVTAPARVLAKLAIALKVPLDALAVALERRFAGQTVPAFKATEAKPTVPVERKAWSVAVKELQLPADEEERLLKLEG
jgi:hypothetical protein